MKVLLAILAHLFCFFPPSIFNDFLSSSINGMKGLLSLSKKKKKKLFFDSFFFFKYESICSVYSKYRSWTFTISSFSFLRYSSVSNLTLCLQILMECTYVLGRVLGNGEQVVSKIHPNSTWLDILSPPFCCNIFP